MGKVGTGFSTSLDGFIAEPSGDVGPLFDWYFGGDTDYTMPSSGMTLRVSPQSAELLRESHDRTGALVVGRWHFDHARAWGGRHPIDVPIVVVVTHAVPQEWAYEGPPFAFVTEGVEREVKRARAAAGGGDVGVGGVDHVPVAVEGHDAVVTALPVAAVDRGLAPIPSLSNPSALMRSSPVPP